MDFDEEFYIFLVGVIFVFVFDKYVCGKYGVEFDVLLVKFNVVVFSYFGICYLVVGGKRGKVVGNWWWGWVGVIENGVCIGLNVVWFVFDGDGLLGVCFMFVDVERDGGWFGGGGR